MESGKIRPEDLRKPSQKEITAVGELYHDFYTFRNYRSGVFRQLQYRSFEEFLRISRELFWNSNVMQSEDLDNLGLELAIPFTRKEVNDFVTKISSMGYKGRMSGDGINGYSLKVLQGLYQRWRFKSNDKVEKFWQVLYGVVNGTTCTYVGFNNSKVPRRILTKFNPTDRSYVVDSSEKAMWNDVETKIVPLEDIYLKKIYERDIQKQGKIIWKTQMEKDDFMREFKMYPDAKYVQVGSRIAEDSLYYRLLGGSGVTTANKIEVLRSFDTDRCEYMITANGILLNRLGNGDDDFAIAPMPFKHGLMPFTWSITEPIDDKFAYGLSLPFKVKDLHKILNTQYIMLIERELRSIDRPVLTSDLESPPIIYGQKKVIPVTDVNAYKEMDLVPATSDYFSTMNSTQSLMAGLSQGGNSQIVPSIQPKSAAEVDQLNAARQQAMGTALLMYYNMVRQEMLLVLKTMLQFYSVDKYTKEERILRNIVIPESALTNGGTGNLEIRLVKEVKNPLELYFESVQRSIIDGKMTEIIEAPIELVENLEFEITQIDLEPDQTSDMKKSIYTSQFLLPLIQNWGQSGLIDPAKTLLRFMEKSEEAPQDYVTDQNLPQMLSAWHNKPNVFMPMTPGGPGTPAGLNRATPAGTLAQSPFGQAFGGLSNGGRGIDLSRLNQNAQ